MESAPQRLPGQAFSLRRVGLAVLLLGSACALAAKVAVNQISDDATRHTQQRMLHWFELGTPSPRLLDSRFGDADGDLVADPPQEASGRRSPDDLVFSFLASPTAEEQLRDWADFIAHLAKVTGRPVKAVAFTTNNDQEDALEQGKLDVAAFNTGAVPAAVATDGFVPFCTFGKENGSFGITMQFIVPADSQIKKLEDVKGQSFTFTSPDSNSGCKAALVVLQDHDLLPQRDYLWRFSLDHEESILRIASGEHDVAAVASDVLQRMIAAGRIKPDQIRIIYESERFPPATFGYAHDLSDELAANIRKAFFEFDFHGTSLEKRFDDSQTSNFVPLSYRDDYALVRRINASFRKPPMAASH